RRDARLVRGAAEGALAQAAGRGGAWLHAFPAAGDGLFRQGPRRAPGAARHALGRCGGAGRRGAAQRHAQGGGARRSGRASRKEVMMATASDLRRVALSLEGTTEAPHFDRAAFKVKRIYTTLAAD